MARYQSTVLAKRKDTEKRCKQLMSKIETEHQHLTNLWNNESADTNACADLMGLTLKIAKMQESEESVMQAALERLIGQISSGAMTVQTALLSIGDLIRNQDSDAAIENENTASPEPLDDDAEGPAEGDLVAEANAEAEAADENVDESAKDKLVAENKRLEQAAEQMEDKLAKHGQQFNDKLNGHASDLLSKMEGDLTQAELEAELAKFQANANSAHAQKQSDQKSVLTQNLSSVAVDADAEYMNAFLSDDFLANMIDFEPTVDADAQLESTFSQISTEEDFFSFSDEFMIDFEPSMDGGVQLNSKFARPANLSDAAVTVISAKAESVEQGIADLSREISGDPDAILNTAAAGDRRRRLAAARARMNANMNLSAKLRNILAARMKALEGKLENLESEDTSVGSKRRKTMAETASAIEAELSAVELELADPDAILSAEASAERRRRLKAMRARLDANSTLDAKLRNRLAAKLRGLNETETEIAAEVDPDGEAAKRSMWKEGVDIAAIATEEKRKAKVKLATIRQNVANMKALMLKGLDEKDIPPQIRMALLALEDQAEKFERQIVEDSAHALLSQIGTADSDKMRSAVENMTTESSAPSRMSQAAIRGAVERDNKVEAAKVDKLEKMVESHATTKQGRAALIKAAGVRIEKAEEDFADKQYKLRLAHEAKIRGMEVEAAKQLKAEEELAMSKLDGLFIAEKDRLVTDSGNDFEQVMEQQAEMLNHEDAEMLMADHEASKAARDGRLNEERGKQKDALKARLAKAKKAKLARIARMQGLEVKEMNEKMAADQRSATTKDLRTEAMANMKDTSQKTVLDTLAATHKAEMTDLIAEHDRLAAIRIAREVEHAHEDRAAEREALTIAHSKELVRYVNENGSAEDKDLFEKGRAELAKAHEAALERFDEQNREIFDRAEAHATTTEALKRSARQLELRETQCREVADTLARLHPSASLSREYEEKAEAAAKEATEQRRNIASLNKGDTARKKEEMRERFDAETKARLDAIAAQMVALDNEIVQEKEKTKSYVAAKIAEKEDQLTAERTAKEAKKYEEDIMSKLTEQDSEELMKQAADDAESALKALNDNRSKQKGTIAKRLAERRAKRAAAALAAGSEAGGSPKPGPAGARGADDADAGEVFPATSSGSSAGSAGRPGGGRGRPAGGASAGAGSGSGSGSGISGWDSDEDAAGGEFTQIPDNVLQKIKDIEALMTARNGVPFATVAYVDPQDEQWANGATSLREAIVKRSDLSADEEKALQFGNRQADTLSDKWELDAISIKVVNDLPVDTATGHAFPCSYCYNPNAMTLYVRRQRLDNVGLFMMVVLHGMSHIKVDSMVDDNNPHFVEAFYNGMQIISMALFETRSKAVNPIDSLQRGNGADAREKRLDAVLDLKV